MEEELALQAIAEHFAPELDGLRVDVCMVEEEGGWAPGCTTAFPLPQASCPSCGPMNVVAQFWSHGRLWRFSFCRECQDYPASQELVSAGREHGLADRQVVVGNSPWRETPAQMLVSVDSHAWKTHPVMQDILPTLGAVDDQEDFRQSLSKAMNLAPIPWATSRVGGVPDFIQGDIEHLCPQCLAPMMFLAQLGEDAGFHYADAGVAYLFFCPQHVQCTHAWCDTH